MSFNSRNLNLLTNFEHNSNNVDLGTNTITRQLSPPSNYEFTDIRYFTNHWYQVVKHQLEKNTDDRLSIFKGNGSLIDVEILQDFNSKSFTKTATRNYVGQLRDYFNQYDNDEINPAKAIFYMSDLCKPSHEITEAVLHHLKLCRTNVGLEEFTTTLLQFTRNSSLPDSFSIIKPYYNIILLAAPCSLFPMGVTPQEIMVVPIETVCTTLIEMSNDIQNIEIGRMLRIQNSVEDFIPEYNGLRTMYNTSLSIATRLGMQWGFRHRYLALGFLHLLNPSLSLALTWIQRPQITTTPPTPTHSDADREMIDECARVLVSLLTFD